MYVLPAAKAQVLRTWRKYDEIACLINLHLLLINHPHVLRAKIFWGVVGDMVGRFAEGMWGCLKKVVKGNITYKTIINSLHDSLCFPFLRGLINGGLTNRGGC